MTAPLIRFVTLLLIFAPLTLHAEENVKKSKLKVASLSIFPEKWNKEANAEKIEKMVRQAAKEKVDLVITPEGVLEGYVVNEVIKAKTLEEKKELTQKFQEIAEPIDGQYIKQFSKLADELNIYLILGFLEKEGTKTYNTAVLLSPDGKVIGKYRKTHFHQGYKVNPPGYTPGNDYPVFDVGRFKTGMMICFDRQLPEPARQLTLNGADIIICPSYGGWGDWNTRLMQVRAYENQVSVVFTHPEQSLIINRNGDLVKECRKDEIAISEIDLSKLEKTRKSVINRRPETYQSP